jgi:endonuclease-3
MEELVELPGVGRKTANCILGGAYGIAAGIVVDTHVSRLAALLGLTDDADPASIESDLCQLVERKDWIYFGNALITHGRRICSARRPKCAECVLNRLCPSAAVKGKGKT